MGLFDNLDPVAGSTLISTKSSGLFDAIPEQPGPFMAGVKSGAAGVKSAAGGLVSLAGRGFGLRKLEDAGSAITAAAEEDAAQYSRKVEDVQSVGEGIDFAKYALGSAIPSMLAMLAGGAVGRGLGAIRARGIAEEATRRFVKDAGLLAGGAATSVGIEAGSIFPEAVKEGVDSPVARSLAGGVAAGAMDILPEVYFARLLGLLGKAERAGRGAVRGAAAGVAKGAVVEGGTEALQTVIERIAAGQDLSSQDGASDILNSAVVGAISGGAFGGAAGAVDGSRRAPGALPAPSSDQTSEAAPAVPEAPVVSQTASPLPGLEFPQQTAPASGPAGKFTFATRMDETAPPAEDRALPSVSKGVVPAEPAADNTAQPALPRIPGGTDLEPRISLEDRVKMAAANSEYASAPERVTRQFLETQREQLRGERDLLSQKISGPASKAERAKAIRRISEIDRLDADYDRMIKTQAALEASRPRSPKTRYTNVGTEIQLPTNTAPKHNIESAFEIGTLRRAASEAPGFDRTGAELAVLRGDTVAAPEITQREVSLEVPLPSSSRSRIVYDNVSRAEQERAALEEQRAREAEAKAGKSPSYQPAAGASVNEAAVRELERTRTIAEAEALKQKRAEGVALTSDELSTIRAGDALAAAPANPNATVALPGETQPSGLPIEVPLPSSPRSKIVYDANRRAADEAAQTEEENRRGARTGSFQEPVSAEQERLRSEAAQEVAAQRQAEEVKRIRAKKAAGELLSADEAKALRAASGPSSSTGPAPALDVVSGARTSRGIQRQGSAKDKLEHFYDVGEKAVNAGVGELRTAGIVKEKTATSVSTAMKASLREAAKAADVESAKELIAQSARRVLRGKLRKEDVDTFIERVMSHMNDAPQVFLSQAGVDAGVKLSHWSNRKGIKRLEPKYYGTGIAGAEAKRKQADPDNWVDRIYFGVDVGKPGGYVKEPTLGPNQYVTSVAADRLYDFSGDPLGLRAQAKRLASGWDNPTNVYEKLIRTSGFLGYWVQHPSLGRVAAVFDALDVENGAFSKAPLVGGVKDRVSLYALPKSAREVHSFGSADKARAALTRAAVKAFDIHNEFGGSSVNAVTGENLAFTPVYAVSPFKEREVVVAGKLTQEQLTAFVQANADLLSDSRNAIGTWYNEADGNTYLDVSTTTPNLEDALDIARAANQLALMDLRTLTEIPTGHPVFDSAVTYNASIGRPAPVKVQYIEVDGLRARAIASAYDGLQKRNDDAATQIAYGAFAGEIERQFEHASKSFTFEPWNKEGQPYANSAEMRTDVFENNHLWVFKGGEAHPYLTHEQNWKFRAIHDLYGHAKTGFEFGPKGELNATRAHAQMFTEAALPALVTETIGQNSWVNFGQQNAGKAPADRAYAEQKADLLPEHLWRPMVDDGRDRQATAYDRQDQAFAQRGAEISRYLSRILGSPDDLVVSMFSQDDPAGFAGRYHTTPTKDLIELAYNAKDVLSVAAHEAFHRIEMKHLSHSERVVLRRGLKPGSALYNRLLERASVFDAQNGTRLAEEISSVPQEAHAYGFEFWRRGELQADSALQNVFQKIQRFLERVRNFISGYGFTSVEDLYRAVELGRYAQTGTKGGNAVVAALNADLVDYLSDVEPDAAPTGKVFNRDPAASKAKGRPYWVRSPADVVRMRARIKSLALEGERGRDWHARSGAAVNEWANGDKQRAAVMAALISNYSPRTPVGLDLKKAVTTIVQWDQNLPLNPGAPKAHIDGAIKILRGEGERDHAGNIHPTGIKRDNFFKNLMLGIDPQNYSADDQGATIDMWMAHAFGYANDAAGSVSKSEYRYADAETKRLAKELGWTVEETQAAIWIAIKARGNAVRSKMEHVALTNGWYEVKQKASNQRTADLFGMTEKGQRVVKKVHEREFVETWMDLAMRTQVTDAQIDKANYSYFEAFRDIRNGTLAMPEDLPFELDTDAKTETIEPDPQLSLFSRAPLADLVSRAKAGEIEHTQLMAGVAQAFDDAEIPDATVKGVLGARWTAMKGGLARAYLSNISSGMNLARQSKAYENVFNVLTAFSQRKNRLISEGVDVKLSQWVQGRASQADITAVGKALFERTVNAYELGSAEMQRVLSGLNDKQQAMFKQATDMVADRLDAEFIADQRVYSQALGLDSEAFNTWREHREQQIQRLKREGYVPERRYGDHVVYVQATLAGGKKVTVLSEQFESQAEATLRMNQYKDVLGTSAPELQVEYGFRYKAEHDATLSFRQFLDIARRYGVDISQTERERLAKAMISADSVRRNRIFRRKNVPGYSEDAMRVLSEFAVTMSNKIAYSEFSEAIGDALAGQQVFTSLDPKGNPVVTRGEQVNMWKADGPNGGFFRDMADKTAAFALSPQDESGWSRTARMAASLHFLGGSVAAAVVQLSALPMNTIPYLSGHTSYTNAFGKTMAAFKIATKSDNFRGLRDLAKLQDRSVSFEGVDNVPGLRDALTRAAQDGTTLDTEIYQIMGLTRGGVLAKSRGVQRAIDAWMYPFRATEQVNRIASFIAAYRVGLEKQLTGDKLYGFAQKVVQDTQHRYDEANRPALARDRIWAVLFTFKSFSIFQTEMLTALARERPQAAVVMLLSLQLAAGVEGLPFAEDLMDVVDTIAQRVFKSPFNSKRALRNVAKSASEALAGVDLSGIFMHGLVNELTGLSFASRVGMGNLIPGTRLFAADSDYKRTAQEVFGPVGSMVAGAVEGANAMSKGQFLDAWKRAAPLSMQNTTKGLEQWSQGYAKDAGGRKLIDVSGWEAAWQTLGFSSAALNKAYELDRIDKQTVAFYNMVREDFTTDLVKAIQDKDTERVKEITLSVSEWNKAHQDMPVALSASSIRRRVAEAGMPINQRTLETLPRALRAGSLALEVTRGE